MAGKTRGGVLSLHSPLWTCNDDARDLVLLLSIYGYKEGGGGLKPLIGESDDRLPVRFDNPIA